MAAMSMMTRYALVTLTPLALLILAATAWGGFAWAALLWLTLIAAGLDGVLAPPARPAVDADHTPWPDRLSVTLALGCLVLLPLVLVALSTPGLTFGQRAALFFATASFFGQVGHPNAHELIHRRPPLLHRLGAAVYSVLGFGHHVSAHRLVHHRHVGTDRDPNTPLPGESFWAYLPRAWAGSFEAGLACEEDRLARRGLPPRGLHNPFWVWLGGAVASLVLALWLSGIGGAFLLLGFWALMGGQILMSDYIQHYGLQRLLLDSGRVEPVAAHHSWNAPRGFSSFLMLNAPAHSEHHLHPDRPYGRLDPAAPAPTLPYSMPIMATLATIPPAWHRVMDRRALKVMEAAQVRLQGRSHDEGAGPSADDVLEAPGAEGPIQPSGAAPRQKTARGSETDALLSRVAQAAGEG